MNNSSGSGSGSGLGFVPFVITLPFFIWALIDINLPALVGHSAQMNNFFDFGAKLIFFVIYILIGVVFTCCMEEPIGFLCGLFLSFTNLTFVWPSLWAIPEAIFGFIFNLLF
jgi:hypothetical protein